MSTEDRAGRIKRRPYYICAPAYSSASAGIRVLHHLAHHLNLAGYPSYIFSRDRLWPRTDDRLFTPLLTQARVDADFAEGLLPIVVYPDSQADPYLGGGFLWRYYLNYAGFFPHSCTYNSEEAASFYSAAMARYYGKEEEDSLFLPVSDPTFWRPSTGLRSGFCYYGGKHRYVQGRPLPAFLRGGTEISTPYNRAGSKIHTREQIRLLFQQSDRFYCFEDTALITEALLCGCPVVILRDESDRPLIAIEELQGKGIALDDSPQALKAARESVSGVRDIYGALLSQIPHKVSVFAEKSQHRVVGLDYRVKVRFDDWWNTSVTMESALMGRMRGPLGRFLFRILRRFWVRRD